MREGELYGKATVYAAYIGMAMLLIGLAAQWVLSPTALSCTFTNVLGGLTTKTCGESSLTGLLTYLGLQVLAGSVVVGLLAIIPYAARVGDAQLIAMALLLLAILMASALGAVKVTG